MRVSQGEVDEIVAVMAEDNETLTPKDQADYKLSRTAESDKALTRFWYEMMNNIIDEEKCDEIERQMVQIVQQSNAEYSQLLRDLLDQGE